VQQTARPSPAFFNFGDPRRLIFTKNATEALNIAIQGVLKPGDHVIATSLEHNSVARPLKHLERDRGIEVTFVRAAPSARSLRMTLPVPSKRTRADRLHALIQRQRRHHAGVRDRHDRPRPQILFLVDASQGAGSIPVDAAAMGIDLLAFPGHKGLLGPQGTGGCTCGRESPSSR